MATVTEIARKRKNELRLVSKHSRTLDAQQEKLEREVRRLMNRKKAVPDLQDAKRLIALLQVIQQVMNTMSALFEDIAQSWS